MGDPAVAVAHLGETVETSRPNTVVLARSISILTVGQIVTWIATLIWTVIVPRRLGSAQVGLYTLGLAASGVLLVLVGLGSVPSWSARSPPIPIGPPS